jgi:hypothetical protein
MYGESGLVAATLPELLMRKETKRTRWYFGAGAMDLRAVYLGASVALNEAADHKFMSSTPLTKVPRQYERRPIIRVGVAFGMCGLLVEVDAESASALRAWLDSVVGG